MVTLLETPYIEVNSSDIIEILRSPESLPLSGRKATFSVQGYICITKQENRQLVHAALYVKEIQRSLIFTESETAAADAGRQKCEEFLALLGFRLQPVNLKFSSAMRDVILREIPVILSPETAQKNLREKKKNLAEWKRLINEPVQDQRTDGPELSIAEWAQRKESQENLAKAKKAAADNLAGEEKTAQKISILREIIDGPLRQTNGEEIVVVESSNPEGLQTLLAEMQEQTGEREKRILQLEEELAAEKAERNQLVQEKKLAGVLLAECRQQLAQAESAREREAEERKVSDLARKDAEKRFAALHETARRLHEQLALDKTEREQLLQEKETADRLISSLQQSLLQTGETTRTEVSRPQTEEVARELTTAEEELRMAREQIAAGEAERRRLAIALETMDKRLTEMPADPAITAPVSGETDERIRQMQTDLRQAAEKGEFLRQEIENLAAGKTAAEKRLAELEATGSTPAAVPVSRLKPADADPPPHMVRRARPGALFHVNWDLTGIPYDSPEEIHEVHQTMNRVRLSLEGYPDQYCSASLIITEIAGKKGVFIAFRLSSSNRVLVYVPITLPDSPKAFTTIIKEAEKFIQVVGLDIEPVPLSKNSQERAKTLEGLSVLQHPEK